MSHPESNPIVVLDFGAQYSKLIARRIMGLDSLLRSALTIQVFAFCWILLSFSGCTRIIEYKIRDVRVSAPDEYDVSFAVENKRTLRVMAGEYEVVIYEFYRLMTGPDLENKPISFRVGLSNKPEAANDIQLKSALLRPQQYRPKRPSNKVPETYSASTTTFLSFVPPKPEMLPINLSGPHNHINLGFHFPFKLRRGQVELQIVDPANGNQFDIVFELYR